MFLVSLATDDVNKMGGEGGSTTTKVVGAAKWKRGGKRAKTTRFWAACSFVLSFFSQQSEHK